MKILISFLIFMLLFACRQESFTNASDIVLKSSVDTLHFDTVFTTTGSITQFFKIINDNSKGIHISAVELAGGASSSFKMNVSGQPGTQINNLDVNGNDSAYVFVSVNINPTATNLPFVIRDSIAIRYNGNTTWVQLEAYGRNAHFIRNGIIAGHQTWTNDLPYVVLNGLTIDEKAQLVIEKGCQIYMHADAPLVVNGTLEVWGEKWDSTRVTFTGDRLDDPYRDFPASWPGIYFSATSKDNQIQYAVIKNAYQAVVVQNPSVNNTPKLQISETIIDNAYEAGIIAVNSSIQARNLLVSNCGQNVLLYGGDYQFTHCTLAAYSNAFLAHKAPVLSVSDQTASGAAVNSLKAIFRNCIIWGDGNLVPDEVSIERKSNASFNLLFDDVLWKMNNPPANLTATQVINNEPPLFDSINTAKNVYRFNLKETSPAINKGINTNLDLDLDGNPRPVGLPDLGCYERQ